MVKKKDPWFSSLINSTFSRNKSKNEQPKSKPKKTAKEIATEKSEPYVEVITLELDADDMNAGAFELDWNDKFIANLVRAGYQMKPNEDEHEIVDRWFQNVCRNVVMETHEQEQADLTDGKRPIKEKDIGGGRREMS